MERLLFVVEAVWLVGVRLRNHHIVVIHHFFERLVHGWVNLPVTAVAEPWAVAEDAAIVVCSLGFFGAARADPGTVAGVPGAGRQRALYRNPWRYCRPLSQLRELLLPDFCYRLRCEDSLLVSTRCGLFVGTISRPRLELHHRGYRWIRSMSMFFVRSGITSLTIHLMSMTITNYDNLGYI